MFTCRSKKGEEMFITVNFICCRYFFMREGVTSYIQDYHHNALHDFLIEISIGKWYNINEQLKLTLCLFDQYASKFSFQSNPFILLNSLFVLQFSYS